MTGARRPGGRLPRIVGVLVMVAAVLLPGAVPQAAAGEPGSTEFLAVRIDSVSPEVITTGSDPAVTVTATVENVGDRPVRDIVARLEHAPAITSSAQLRTDLGGENSQYAPVAEFVTVAGELQRGERANFRLSYPLRSATEPALGFDAPGVYPLLVNVNGTPDYGEPARLDDARFLLPVLGLPPAAGNDTSTSLDGVVAPDTTRPMQMTMMWPLADKPRLAPGVPGGVTPVRLTDDVLATSLAGGGRLDTLLGAVEFITGPTVDPGGEVTRALCLAVDPDLLVTVNAMTRGYVVTDGAAGPTAASHPGTGQAAAVAWLDRLRALASRMCVTTTPYAQASLDALQRVGDPRLSAFATTGSADLADRILGVPTTRGATLIGDGQLTRGVVDLLGMQGPTVAITAADCTAADAGTGPEQTADLTPRRMSPQVVAAPFDPTVGAALAAAGGSPTSPSYLDQSLTIPLRHDSPTARRQDALGSILWRGLSPDTTPRTQILMPPTTWDLRPQDAQALLSALATTIRSGLAVPRPLTDLIADADAGAQPPAPDSATVVSRDRFADDIVNTIAGQIGRLWGLTAALTTDPQTGLTGQAYTAPLREDMLRALSQSEPADIRDDLATDRLQAVGVTIDDLYHAVTIVVPGGSYTLATERSPLPLALRNDLAVPIRVRLQVDAPPGMTVTDIGEQELPPGFLPVRVPIEVHFTQRVAVDVSLHTPDGLALGEPVRLSVHSNAYGKVLFFITLTAGAVLAVLTGRRLWHRFRGQPDRADLDRPEPRRP